MGFLRQKADGTTSLSFLTGGDGVIPGTERDRPVTLGSLIGKVSQATQTRKLQSNLNALLPAIAYLYFQIIEELLLLNCQQRNEHFAKLGDS